MSDVLRIFEPMEMTFTIEDADLITLREVLEDINIPDCPWFEVQDKHGNRAKYYREQQWIPVTERLPEEKDAGILKKLGTEKRSEHVLATVEVKGERMTVTACTYDGKWDWNMKYAFPDFKVIAWMTLPEPYAERRTDE